MVITLCGSTRFKSAFMEWNAKLGLKGHAVFNLSMFGREESDAGKPSENIVITEAQKITLDLVHLAKIDVSDAIFILNVDKYIGFSTRREIEWARMRGKEIIWLEYDQPNMQYGDLTSHNQGFWKDQ